MRAHNQHVTSGLAHACHGIHIHIALCASNNTTVTAADPMMEVLHGLYLNIYVSWWRG